MTIDDGNGSRVRVLITGGGTGGHLTPALALARELSGRPRPARVLLVGGTAAPDRALLPTAGLPHRFLRAPLVERRRWWRNATFPFAFAAALRNARAILRDFRPDVVIATGGYASVPVGVAAGLAGVPLLLQEQNRTPGLATRLLARWARRICVQFAEAAPALERRAPVEVTGSPITPPAPAAADFAGRLDPSRPTVGVFGGSQGARALNQAALALWSAEPEAGPNVVWQTGPAGHAWVEGAARWPDRFVIRPFFTPMAAVYQRLDLIVCRAGAMTLAEITAWGVPAVLVPYPYATADHQTANARALEAAGAAVVVPEAEADARLGPLIAALLEDRGRRNAMAAASRALGRPDAATVVADRALALAAGDAEAR